MNPRLFFGLRVVEFFIFATEPLDAAGRVDELLLAGKKRMALGTNFHADIGLGGACLEFIAAGAPNRCLVTFRMSIFFHRMIAPVLCIHGIQKVFIVFRPADLFKQKFQTVNRI